MQDSDVIVIGSGIGGLTVGALLCRYGKQVIVCESHTIAGGAAHSFQQRGFQFDSGPSFYCGLSHPQSLNPVRQVLAVLAYYLRRHQGTYGPAIAAGEGMFPGPYTPISGLYRVGDSTMPGIGVPGVAASGILCANTLVGIHQHNQLLTLEHIS